MRNKVLFLTLKIFSATGGIEKVCRIVGKALYEGQLQFGGQVKIFSMYGNRNNADGNKYFPQLLFRGFSGWRIRFVLRSMREGRRSRLVLMSHVNLLLVGWLIKKINPATKLVLIAHGIEVWYPFAGWRKRMLKKVDLFLPVSQFTRDKMIALYGLPEERFLVLNNCLDPFLELPLEQGKRPDLLERYELKSENKVLLTVTRLKDTEQYKGYDKVLQALPALLKTDPGIRYLLLGKYDEAEKQRLDRMISGLGVGEQVIFGGFITDEELGAHFKLADVFVMPSSKEGFGIVFIEAMFYELPVIAGNKDGSVDALSNGELGILVDPENLEEVTAAIQKVLTNRAAFLPDRGLLMERFGYEGYKRKLLNIVEKFRV